MKMLIGVDPHKTSVAVAAVDEAVGELVERASFPPIEGAPRFEVMVLVETTSPEEIDGVRSGSCSTSSSG